MSEINKGTFFKVVSVLDELPIVAKKYHVIKENKGKQWEDAEPFTGKRFMSPMVTHWLKQVSI